MSSKNLVLLHCMAVLLLVRSVSSSQDNAFLFHVCSDIEGTFTTKSPYETNLNMLLGSLSYKAPPTGFGLGSAGQSPDKVNGLALCRGDVSPADCRSCITAATPELRKRCPNNKGGAIWYDFCLVKHSTINFFGKIDYDNKFYLYNVNNVTDPTSFNAQTKNLLSRLSKEAAAVKKLYAAGEDNLYGGAGSGKKKLYGLVQCTRDLTSEACTACLDGIIGELPNCCDGKEGGRVVGTSCNFRYEIYPFVSSS
ncbi:PREDICTED: cysteine-rich repeat secretory protein 38-like [Tarenaya hassleriana]|uniref:cysteine-rich repeat secretory protein 38-like n=1 Tax=Tarenaya hassleriana TaxID=28532 RepID=UPI00053C8EA2|nr:PREDICTED: cysteine-rich repeat secretory protein 38-like [Tarenaya hassleriana]